MEILPLVLFCKANKRRRLIFSESKFVVKNTPAEKLEETQGRLHKAQLSPPQRDTISNCYKMSYSLWFCSSKLNCTNCHHS